MSFLQYLLHDPVGQVAGVVLLVAALFLAGAGAAALRGSGGAEMRQAPAALALVLIAGAMAMRLDWAHTQRQVFAGGVRADYEELLGAAHALASHGCDAEIHAIADALRRDGDLRYQVARWAQAQLESCTRVGAGPSAAGDELAQNIQELAAQRRWHR